MPTPRLIVNEPTRRGRFVPLVGKAISIGREKDNSIRIEDDEEVSRYHALIEYEDGEYWITDVGSSNGTTVNGEPLTEPRRLRDRDIIRLGGPSTLEFYLSDSPPQDDTEKTAVGPTPLPPPPPPKRRDDPPPPPKKEPAPNNFPVGAVIAIVGIVLAGTVVAVLINTGVIGGRREQGPNVNVEPTPVAKVNANQTVYETPTPEPSPTQQVVEPPPPPVEPQDSNVEAVRKLAPALAGQITGKGYSFYTFHPDFVRVISRHLDGYKVTGYHARAEKYVSGIDLSFNNKGVPRLLPYVLAMSQTKFVAKGAGGVWFENPPPSVVGNEGGDDSDITSAAAKHLISRLDLFGQDGFMYAVACYGVSDDEANKVFEALQKNDPDRRERYDFWKMVKAGVVKDEQVNRVARFIAAGIVCENPAEFNLKDDTFSSFYKY